VPAYVALLTIHLHFPEAGSLKAKRKDLSSVKAQLHGRLGVAVAEVGHQDTWQRATLLCALVGRSEADLAKRADRLEEIVVARAGEGASFRRELRSLEDLSG
jgi:uncharacterized protein YlxP (DUF503 family)